MYTAGGCHAFIGRKLDGKVRATHDPDAANVHARCSKVQRCYRKWLDALVVRTDLSASGPAKAHEEKEGQEGNNPHGE